MNIPIAGLAIAANAMHHRVRNQVRARARVLKTTRSVLNGKPGSNCFATSAAVINPAANERNGSAASNSGLPSPDLAPGHPRAA